MDLSPQNKKLNAIDLDDHLAFSNFINQELALNKVDYGIGGYLEERNIYRRGELFEANPNDFRNIHLGIDIWGQQSSVIYNPLDGELVAAHNNAGYADYGPTLIMKYAAKESPFFVLFGHLSLGSLSRYEIGQKIPRGAKLAEFGAYDVNGNWPPHVHVQIIKNLKPGSKDHIGVCSREEINAWTAECPNPNLIIC